MGNDSVPFFRERGESMVEEALNIFVQTLQDKQILKPLYKNKELVISFQTEESVIYLQLIKGQCSVTADFELSTASEIHIQGDDTTLLKLINGQEKLSTLKGDSSLSIKGKDNDLLALESLFILTNGKEKLLHNHT